MKSTFLDRDHLQAKHLFTLRVGELPRARTAPVFVSRRTAAALLDMSNSGFGTWVKRGLLPGPVAGAPADEPRWLWPEIVAWILGDRSTAPRDLFGKPPAVRTGKRSGPAPGHGGRPRKAARERLKVAAT